MIDPDKLDKDVCQEILSEAQDRVKTQLGAADSLSAKLSAILSQAATLSVASFGAASLAFPAASSSPPWMPAWAACGLAASGVAWLFAGIFAIHGLKPEKWLTGFYPRKRLTTSILDAVTPSEAFLRMAWGYEEIIEHNADLNAKLAMQVRRAQWTLIWAVVIGLFVAGSAFDVSAVLNNRFQPIEAVAVLAFLAIVILAYLTFDAIRPN